MSDEMAYGALRTMARHGLAPGGDAGAGQVAVIGFDGHDLAEAFDLSTVRQPVRDLGTAAVELLMAQIAGEAAPGEAVLPTSLEVRGSTGGSTGG
jgi:DNA-binding LacI/PurR family transcriptional regulator